jgi:putative spermidine/putrescine transport system permease protein
MRSSRGSGLVVATPFVAFVGLFLLYPTGVVLFEAVTPGGEFGLSALERAMSGPYRQGFINSTLLSLATAIIGGILGTALALIVRGMERPRWLGNTVDSWSAVASQLGGVPLAFAFIAALGTQGIVTRILFNAGLDITDTGFTLSGFWGLVVVYLYFQIPLMFLVTMPAVQGLRRTWREAAAIMGAKPIRYWRRVGVPILLPAMIGGMLLLFVNSFAAYATVFVLNPGAQLIPLQIRYLLQGNIITGEADLGNAIVAWVTVLLLASLLIMTYLQRVTLKWTRDS